MLHTVFFQIQDWLLKTTIDKYFVLLIYILADEGFILSNKPLK